MKEKGDLQRLYHVRQCIVDLENMLASVDDDSFYRSTEKKYAVERALEIIGEAIKNISPQTLGLAPIEWHEIIGFRNLVSHEYFRIDYKIVYEAATKGIMELKPTIEQLIGKLESGKQ